MFRSDLVPAKVEPIGDSCMRFQVVLSLTR